MPRKPTPRPPSSAPSSGRDRPEFVEGFVFDETKADQPIEFMEDFLATPDGTVEPGRQESRIFITPGYEFRAVQGMFTNFHLPKTTMLLMISALTGRERVLEAYRQAVENRYRFLSFGDSMLIL